MISFPNAKINLGLHVIRKRDDGFHDIETVFFPIQMHDSLEILVKPGETSITQHGPALPGGENIVTKAYELLKSEYGIPAVDIHLLKHIPTGAGLGGGSSDAAHTLLMLNDLFRKLKNGLRGFIKIWRQQKKNVKIILIITLNRSQRKTKK